MPGGATHELSYNTVSLVMEGWEDLRRTPDYERVAGTKVLQRLFTKCPESKVLFGFDSTIDPYGVTMTNNNIFINKAQTIIQMFDIVFSMLGPDLDLLTEILQDVAMKHERFGVSTIMFQQMEHCLVETIEEVLGTNIFPLPMKAAFQVTYQSLLSDMKRSTAYK